MGFPYDKHLGIPTPHPGPLPVEGRGRWQRVAVLRRRFKFHHGGTSKMRPFARSSRGRWTELAGFSEFWMEGAGRVVESRISRPGDCGLFRPATHSESSLLFSKHSRMTRVMKIDVKSLFIGAVLGAVFFFAVGATSNDAKHYELSTIAPNAIYRTEVTSGIVMYWNGVAWRDITPR